MATEKQSVDLLPLDDFATKLGPRRDQILAQLTALLHTERPALGDFQDARQIADRHEALRRLYLHRLARLVDAMDAAQAASKKISEIFHNAKDQSSATIRAVDDLMDGGSEVPGGRPDHAG